MAFSSSLTLSARPSSMDTVTSPSGSLGYNQLLALTGPTSALNPYQGFTAAIPPQNAEDQSNRALVPGHTTEIVPLGKVTVASVKSSSMHSHLQIQILTLVITKQSLRARDAA